MSDDVSSIPTPGFRGSRAGRYGMGPQPKGGGIDSEARKMMLIAGGLLTVIAGFFAISALRGHHSTGVPVITADLRPIRVKPENPGGLHIQGADNDVFSGGSDTSNPRLAPAAETPDTKALRADMAPPAPAAAMHGPSGAGTTATPGATTPGAAAPASVPLVASRQATPGGVPAPKPLPQPATQAAASKPLVLAGLASPTAKPPPAPVPQSTPATKVAVASLAAPHTATPAARHAESAATSHAETSSAPHAETSSAPHAATQPAVKPAATPAASGKAAVQLAALGTEEAAHTEWQLLARKMPDLLGGRSPVFSRTERDGHVFWRVRVAGFGDTAQGRAFCEHVRAKGGGCSVAEF